MARDWQHSIGIALEPVFGQYTAPTLWLPGEAKLKKSPGVRDLKGRPTGSWDDNRMTTSPTHVTGSLTLEVAPGRETIIQQLLTRRLTGEFPYQTMNSFTVVEVLGDAGAPTDMFVNTGVCANKLTCKAASGEDLLAEVDVLGRERYRPGTPIAPAFTSPPAPYVFEEMLASVNGVYEFHLDSVETDFDHMLKDDRYGSDATGLLRYIPSDGRVITQKMDHWYEHPELWDLAMARQPISTRLVFTRAAYTFVIALPLLYITEGDTDAGKQPLELRAVKPAGSEIVTFV